MLLAGHSRVHAPKAADEDGQARIPDDIGVFLCIIYESAEQSLHSLQGLG